MAKVLVSCYSKSGNTGAMAEIIAAAARDAGAEVISKRAEDTVNDDLLSADAAAIGSPDYFSYVAGQVKVIFDEALAAKSELSGKPALCFSSHGGGGRIKEPFEKLMQAVGFKLVTPCVLSHNVPAGETIDEIREAAKALVDTARE